MQDEQTSILSQTGVRDQVILPLGMAFRLCTRGIRARLGRSVVTLFGVGLGLAFLMSVLAGYHIKHALEAEAALKRDVNRRVVVLRGANPCGERTLAVAAVAEKE